MPDPIQVFDRTNCCDDVIVNYAVEADLVLFQGVEVTGHKIELKIKRNQNIEMEACGAFATQFDTQIFYVTFVSIVKIPN